MPDQIQLHKTVSINADTISSINPLTVLTGFAFHGVIQALTSLMLLQINAKLWNLLDC